MNGVDGRVGPVLRVTAVSGSLHAPSRTRALGELMLATLETRLPIAVHWVDVHRLGPGFTGALAREDVPPEVEQELQAVERADLLLAASPVMRASYTGLFKHFFDLVEQYALAGKPVLLAATGGSDRHALVLEHQLRPLFAYFQALTIPLAIYASSGDFDGQQILNPAIYARIEVAIDDVADLLRLRAERGAAR